jgi:hypothetical protein
MLKSNLVRVSVGDNASRHLTCSILALLFGFGLACGSASADTVTSVSCATPTAPYAIGGASCGATGSYGYAQATVSSSVVLPGTASNPAVIDASSGVTALQTGVHGLTGTATAQSSANIGITFDTGGPVRDGYLELNFLQYAWRAPVNGVISELLTIGSYSASPDGSSLSSIFIPIQLGTQFGFEYLQSAAAIGSSAGGLSIGDIDSQISLFAFEGNGTTPVLLLDPPGNPDALTPEPAAMGIMLVGIAGLALLSKCRR